VPGFSAAPGGPPPGNVDNEKYAQQKVSALRSESQSATSPALLSATLLPSPLSQKREPFCARSSLKAQNRTHTMTASSSAPRFFVTLLSLGDPAAVDDCPANFTRADVVGWYDAVRQKKGETDIGPNNCYGWGRAGQRDVCCANIFQLRCGLVSSTRKNPGSRPRQIDGIPVRARGGASHARAALPSRQGAPIRARRRAARHHAESHRLLRP